MPIDFAKLSAEFPAWYEQFRKEQDMEMTRQRTLDGNTKSFWKTHGTRGNYVSSRDKAAMAASDEVFTITHVGDGEGQFGPKWNVSILRAGVDGEQILSFSKNDTRDAMMEDLRTELLSGYIDASLESFKTQNGNTAYALCPPKDGSDDAQEEDVNE